MVLGNLPHTTVYDWTFLDISFQFELSPLLMMWPKQLVELTLGPSTTLMREANGETCLDNEDPR